MSKRSDPDIPCGQTAMFGYRADATAKALGLDPTRWLYPCGLCNGASVSEPGKLCATCAPTPPRTRRKTAKATTNTTAAGKAKGAKRGDSR